MRQKSDNELLIKQLKVQDGRHHPLLPVGDWPRSLLHRLPGKTEKCKFKHIWSKKSALLFYNWCQCRSCYERKVLGQRDVLMFFSNSLFAVKAQQQCRLACKLNLLVKASSHLVTFSYLKTTGTYVGGE